MNAENDGTLDGGTSRREWSMDPQKPTKTFPPFDLAQHWDADSTPADAAKISRILGDLIPNGPGRTPIIEAAIVLASLMHDVAYYYGGSKADKETADRVFRDQIPYFTESLDANLKRAAEIAAAVDEAAVRLFGGPPFKEPYSWSFGIADVTKRGFKELVPGEIAEIRAIARHELEKVVSDIADGIFEPSALLKAKLNALSWSRQEDIRAAVSALAKAVRHQLKTDKSRIPGFAGG